MRRLDRWGIRRRAVAVAVTLTLALMVWEWPAVDAFGRAGFVLGEVVLQLPADRLAWAAPNPRYEELHWPQGGYGVLTRPDVPDPRPGLLLILGAEPADPDDPRVRQLMEALARVGFVVLLVRSEPLIDGRLTPDEIPLLVGGFRAMQQHPSVRGDRIGLVGLSTGGSMQLIVAADPAVAASVRSVLAIGSYHDAATLAAEVLSGAYRTDAGIVAWDPDETSERVARNTLLTLLPPEEAIRVETAEPATEDGRIVRDVLARPPLETALASLERLSAAARAGVAAISPSAHLSGVRAPVFLLHDVRDPFIPVTHSDAIARQHPPAAYHRLDIFQHVEPRPSNLGEQVRDGWKLLRVFAQVIRLGRE